jgi:hypothetical protein
MEFSHTLLAPEVTSFQSSAANATEERDHFAPYVSKSVPQRLKPSFEGRFSGTAKPVPFVQRRFSLSMFSACAPDEHLVQNAP